MEEGLSNEEERRAIRGSKFIRESKGLKRLVMSVLFGAFLASAGVVNYAAETSRWNELTKYKKRISEYCTQRVELKNWLEKRAYILRSGIAYIPGTYFLDGKTKEDFAGCDNYLD